MRNHLWEGYWLGSQKWPWGKWNGTSCLQSWVLLSRWVQLNCIFWRKFVANIDLFSIWLLLSYTLALRKKLLENYRKQIYWPFSNYRKLSNEWPFFAPSTSKRGWVYVALRSHVNPGSQQSIQHTHTLSLNGEKLFILNFQLQLFLISGNSLFEIWGIVRCGNSHELCPGMYRTLTSTSQHIDMCFT